MNAKILTTALLTCTLGLADAYRRKIKLIDIPINIPTSKRINRHDINVTTAGIISISVKFEML